MAQSKNSDIGCGLVVLIALVGAVWLIAAFSFSHFKMEPNEASTHRNAIEEISVELGSRFSDFTREVLSPRKDDGIDIYVSRSAFESVPYPDRDGFTAGIADIWCAQVPHLLLPSVRFRDIRSGLTLSSNSCAFATAPTPLGTFTGVVTNKTANLSADFSVQIVHLGNSIRGCMQVKPPLYGTGPLKGTIQGENYNFVTNGVGISIEFTGRRSGQFITGTYVVTNTLRQQLGEFRLQESSQASSEVNVENCPSY
jgi:hypothetical protein